MRFLADVLWAGVHSRSEQGFKVAASIRQPTSTDIDQCSPRRTSVGMVVTLGVRSKFTYAETPAADAYILVEPYRR